MTTPHAPDDERLPGEDELSSLYRKLPSIEPPAALDAAVRRAAAEAVKPPVALRRRARWPVALSSAAALVVAAGLAWRMGQMPGKQDALREAATQHEAQTITAQEPVAARPMTAPQIPARIVEPPKQPPPPPQASTRRVIAQAKRMQTAPTPPPAVEEASSNRQLAMPAAPAPPAPPAPLVQSADRAAQADGAIEAFSASAPASKSAAPMPAQAMPAPMAPPMAEQAMSAPAPVNDMSFNKAATPEQELQKIRSLFASNQRDDARKRLADFHRDHPDYLLPADLRDQLLQP